VTRSSGWSPRTVQHDGSAQRPLPRGSLTTFPRSANRSSDASAVSPRPSSSHRGLTRRELDVIRRIAAGQTDREIARALFLSPRTVETHVRHIKEKLNCRSRADTARRAAELGLVSEPGLASQQ
jgi:DNA-binding CsgD family transcriptional regulator